jgi:anti-anti-sigma factor
MELTSNLQGEILVLEVQGRLDGTWADHLAGRLEELVRDGKHHIRLDLSRTSYISSAGIRVLLIFYKQLRSLQGGLEVWQPSEMVREILELSGLQGLLLGSLDLRAPQQPAAESTTEIEHPEAVFRLHGLAPKATLSCTTMGTPERVAQCRFQESDCRGLILSPDMLALGLGAFGSSFVDCRDRFGEFLGAGGALACQPGDGAHAPDYSLAAGSFRPEVKILYGLACRGPLAYLARFEIKPGARFVSLTEIAEIALDASRSERVGIIMMAETFGLIGASLRRSPVKAASESIFRHPGVRDWISFTTERAFPRAASLVVGVASRRQALPANWVRPLAPGSQTFGHFHAAPFTYAPLAKGKIELGGSVSELFQHSRLQGVLHLLGDDRGIGGVGQSEFLRGACWFGPIDGVVTEGS